MRDMVVLLNLDDRACRSMARRLRAEHLYCKILPADASAQDIAAQDALGILIAGAARGEAPAMPNLQQLLDCSLPVLAMGDAALTLVQLLGGSLGEKAPEPGVRQVRLDAEDPLTKGVESGERFLPACRCMTLPAALRPIAQTDGGVLGFRAGERPVYGLAFLPEPNDPDATQLLLHFCRDICGCTLWWSTQTFLERAREEIDRLCQDTDAVCALSGGVDSGVCALLGNLAIGHRLHCLLIDTGLLRKGEADEVMSTYRDTLGLNVTRVNAAGEFLSALRGVTDSAEKERIIHRLLQEIIRREAGRMPGVTRLLQGTNYADALDSPGLDMAGADSPLLVVEPVRELFKDEIRRVGEELQLPPAITGRQPFPGSGLALRILSDVTEERLDILRDADDIFRREIEESGQNKRLWQYFATLACDPIPGATGYVVTLRAVQVIDGNLAVASRLPYDLLERVTQAILTRLPAVHRVLYDFTPSQSYASIEWR